MVFDFLNLAKCFYKILLVSVIHEFSQIKRVKFVIQDEIWGCFSRNRFFFHHKTLTYLRENYNYPNIPILHYFFFKSIIFLEFFLKVCSNGSRRQDLDRKNQKNINQLTSKELQVSKHSCFAPNFFKGMFFLELFLKVCSNSSQRSYLDTKIRRTWINLLKNSLYHWNEREHIFTRFLNPTYPKIIQYKI